MSARIIDTYASYELPADVQAAAWSIAGRRVRRLLSDVSIPPFVVAVELAARLAVADPSDVALFTVSGWDSAEVLGDGFPPNDRESIPDEDDLCDLVQRTQGSPSEWLKYLCNVSLCQIAIVTGIAGPNAHLVGGADALCHGLALASTVLEENAATHALVVAFDALPANGVQCYRAAGLTLTSDHSMGSRGPRLEVLDSSMAFDSALALADACVAAARDSSSSHVMLGRGAVRSG